MEFYIEVFIISLITLIFIIKKKPNPSYLFLGYFFFFVTLILSLPFKILEIYITKLLPVTINSSNFIFSLIFSIFFLFTNYYVIKKFIKTRTLKNAILFAIAWASLYSISFFSFYFYKIIFKLFDISYNPNIFIVKNIFDFSFFLAFPITLAIFILIIKAILKKSKIYLLFAFFLIVLTNYSLGIGNIIIKLSFLGIILLVSFKQLFDLKYKY